MDKIIGIIIGYLLISTFICFPVLMSLGGKIELLPSDLKKKSEMNWFGCIVCSLILFIIFPILYLGELIYILFHFKIKEKK